MRNWFHFRPPWSTSKRRRHYRIIIVYKLGSVWFSWMIFFCFCFYFYLFFFFFFLYIRQLRLSISRYIYLFAGVFILIPYTLRYVLFSSTYLFDPVYDVIVCLRTYTYVPRTKHKMLHVHTRNVNRVDLF